jgi:2-C-methyl-D-erythritol 4-phosphate cytidylyltransferase
VEEPSTYLVAIHDGVRPFVGPDLLARAYDSAAAHGASVAGVPVTHSLRQQLPQGGSQPVDRSEFVEVQTPQTFRLDLILQSYAQHPDAAFTDDASLYQADGHQVFICQGAYHNIKLTTPEDLLVGEGILKREQKG